MRDRAHDAVTPWVVRGLKKHLVKPEFTWLQLRQRTNDCYECIHFARGEWQHELTFQAKFNRDYIVTFAGIPRLLQRSFDGLKHCVGEMRLQLASYQRRVLRVSGKLGDDALRQAEQFKSNRLAAERETQKKVLKRVGGNIQICRQ